MASSSAEAAIELSIISIIDVLRKPSTSLLSSPGVVYCLSVPVPGAASQFSNPMFGSGILLLTESNGLAMWHFPDIIIVLSGTTQVIVSTMAYVAVTPGGGSLSCTTAISGTTKVIVFMTFTIPLTQILNPTQRASSGGLAESGTEMVIKSGAQALNPIHGASPGDTARV